MSELAIVILSSFFRVILGTVLISNEKFRVQQGVFITLLLSFLYSSLLTVIMLSFSRHFIFAIAMIFDTEDHWFFNIIFPLYLMVYLIGMFFIELKNNQYCLEKRYPKKYIGKMTLISFVVSIVLLVAYMWYSA